MKRLVIDLDDTICRNPYNDYSRAEPIQKVIEKLRDYKRLGFQIIINTSRNVRTYEGNVGKITAFTLPIIINWLNLHEVPYDEIYVAKPWCGSEGFYVEDKAIRPSEFLALDYQGIMNLLDAEK
jgi:capsule biosynthesis phosphatase